MMRIQSPLGERYLKAGPEELEALIARAKADLGERLFILGHHYQRDEVMKWADARGDSFALSKLASERQQAQFVVFCGVHFMAESADILTGDHQVVILPDLNAGCSMADMADIGAVEEAWDCLGEIADIEDVVPVTYMNSAASLKAFVGMHGGSVCTSSNAKTVVSWALGETSPVFGNKKLLFFPDQHLGRNTGYQLGFDESHMAVWDPRKDQGGLSDKQIKESTFLLWKGHCSVHQRFKPAHIAAYRQANPEGLVIVHPECAHDVVEAADAVGSTDRIIEFVSKATPGSKIAIGTEIHLVNRLAAENTNKEIVSLDPLVCPCSTMFRIDAAHLAWVLESLCRGEIVNQIQVDEKTAKWARVALQRMLELA